MASASFGDTMRSWREENRITLKEMAAALQYSIPYVSDIERGRRNPPPSDKIKLIAEKVGKTDSLRELLILAMEARGEVALRPRTSQQRNLIVSLNRRLETNTLDAELIRRLRGMLDKEEKA